LFYIGEPYFEKQKSYPQYHRVPTERWRHTNDFPSSPLKLVDRNNDIIEQLTQTSSTNHPHRSKHRAKRQLDFDPMAKHVEVLVAYDHSIKEFHSDADIKSYILTLFSYVCLK
jgi:hypothetical protein